MIKPAVGLAAVPGKRNAVIKLACEIEKRGYSGIYCPSIGDGLALCEAIALSTSSIKFGTGISPIYYRQPEDYAHTIDFINEIAPERFIFGIGVAHERSLTTRGIAAGKPLADTREFVERLRSIQGIGALPPIVLATLRKKMIALAGEIGDGIMFANAARSHMSESLSALPDSVSSKTGFFVGNMIPTCVHNDIDTARAVNRRTLSFYATLPNYRNYWREAGYHREMDAVERCIDAGEKDKIGECLSDQWLDDTTLAGPPGRIIEELDRWVDAGITTPILVPSSANGNQLTAFEELFAVFN